MTDDIRCQDCGAIIEESSGPRKPCPQCGSTRRIFHVGITENVKFYDSLSFKHKKPKKIGRAKIVAEGFNGHEFSHSRQKIVAKQRLIDRDGDMYSETITDIETGEVIHRCEEPLSEHTNHGTAKQKNKDES